MILNGIRVVELATFIFGPAAGTVMADFGADVVKIEAPGRPDPLRVGPLAPQLPKVFEPSGAETTVMFRAVCISHSRCKGSGAMPARKNNHTMHLRSV